jgi:hypothetical protein
MAHLATEPGGGGMTSTGRGFARTIGRRAIVVGEVRAGGAER